MSLTNEMDKIQTLVQTFGPLTKEEIKMYFHKYNGTKPENVESMIYSLTRKRMIYTEGELLKYFPKQKVDKKIIVAFWVMTAFADQIGDRYFHAKYPSQIGFSTDKSVYLITVCDEKYRDKEMIALTEKKEDMTEHIIAGINLDLDEIDPKILPDGKFIYAKYASQNLLTESPKISFMKHEGKE